MDRIHFGLIITFALLIGMATPPMGIGLYIMVEVGKVPFERVAIAVLPLQMLTDDARYESIADAISHEIITDLSTFSVAFRRAS